MTGTSTDTRVSAGESCLDHLDFAGGVCPDCELVVDAYGNTEAQVNDYCSFPDCGCDGSRLCAALNGPSDNCVADNVEGMWSGKSPKQRRARVGIIKYALTKARAASS